MTNTFNPPGSFYRLMALDCRCCPSCSSVPGGPDAALKKEES